jgi:hypothetical protein
MSARGWIRRQLDRPLAGHERSAVTVCGLLLLLAAAGLVLPSPRSSGVAGGERRPRTQVVHASGTAAPRWTPAVAAHTKSTAETFLATYLAYVYGQAPASGVKDATSALVHSLEHEQLRVPPGIRALHPRVLRVTFSSQATERAVAIALITDAEVVRYPIGLVLTESGGRWHVASVEGKP